ncbi:alpha/beta fold hydrolase [Halopiger djelfimassiliensis]|uniref:alpha/beta fold hydrolase n=1 Tax=Halopiger djelfimassiliensis TaxID=1293047 RepID=UPI000677ACC0|nr:alpha/beta hydrolase [Halopiger djelfimassiliensis]
MQTATSPDGTSIAFQRHGDGPPLVLLHGASATRHTWQPLRSHLADAFTLVVPDRRGRGGSGDADAYALEREVEDLCALLDEIDGDPTVFGHSFGGLVALAAADRRAVDRLVLYEPPVLTSDGEGDLADRMQARLDAGRREAAMKLFYREGAGIPAPEELPIWPDRVHFDLVETVIRENRAVETYELPEDHAIDTPTRLLTGERGPEELRDAVRSLHARLPRSELVELDDVGHVGIQSAPDEVAAAVRAFCRRNETR